MRIAIATEQGQVAQHFGRCSHYTLFDMEEQKILKKESVANPGHEPGVLPGFLAQHGVQCIIAGGMGQRARALFQARDIETLVGVQGPVEEIAMLYAQGTLKGRDEYCSH